MKNLPSDIVTGILKKLLNQIEYLEKMAQIGQIDNYNIVDIIINYPTINDEYYVDIWKFKSWAAITIYDQDGRQTSIFDDDIITVSDDVISNYSEIKTKEDHFQQGTIENLFDYSIDDFKTISEIVKELTLIHFTRTK